MIFSLISFPNKNIVIENKAAEISNGAGTSKGKMLGQFAAACLYASFNLPNFSVPRKHIASRLKAVAVDRKIGCCTVRRRAMALLSGKFGYHGKFYANVAHSKRQPCVERNDDKPARRSS